jgi:hypothetical protein
MIVNALPEIQPSINAHSDDQSRVQARYTPIRLNLLSAVPGS